MSETRVAIVGAAGRMGQALVRCAERLPQLRVVGAIDRAEAKGFGCDAGDVAGAKPLGVAISDSLAAIVGEVDVVIDFSFHTAAPETARTTELARRALVVGTTGLTGEEMLALRSASATIPVVWAPNMSLGVNLLFACVKRAGRVLKGYEITVEDVHHIHKKDAPSGTALHLGAKAAEGAGLDFNRALAHDPEGREGIRDVERIVVRSHRRGEVVGDHTVRFACPGETIEFVHRAWSRDAFAMGALSAALWVERKRPRLYDMQDVLRLNDETG